MTNPSSFQLGDDVSPAAQAARLEELAAAVRQRVRTEPRLGLVLGSGLGGVASALDLEAAIPFGELPGWPAATAPGHAGRLLFGRLAGVPAVVQQGRFHMYEGHSAGFVAQPALLMARLGVRTLLLTNAAGGLNPAYGAGTLMIIRDHLNLTGRTPLLGPNDDLMGPRFPDLTRAWDEGLRRGLSAAAAEEGVAMEEGIYACLLGPSYETPAEVRMLRAFGADAVGMSTVPEAIAARWAGMAICGVSLVTNPAAGYSGQELSHEEVLAAADRAGPALGRVLLRFVGGLDTAR